MESQPQNPEFRNNPENFHPFLHPSQQFFSHAGMIDLFLGWTIIKVSYSGTKHSESSGGEFQTSNTLIQSLMLLVPTEPLSFAKILTRKYIFT